MPHRSFPNRLLVLGLTALLAAAIPVRAQLSEKDRSALDEFKKYIKSDEVKVRMDQVTFISTIDGVESTKLILDLGLTDQSPQVRRRAAAALALKEDASAIELISTEGLAHKNERVREGCIRGLGKRDDEKHLAAIAAALETETKAPVLVAALEALAHHRSELGLEAVTRLTTHREPSVAMAAIAMIGETEESRHAPLLHPLLDHKDWSIQVAALEALGKLRKKESVPAVIELFLRAKGRTRGDCRKCLMAITGRQFGFKPERWKEWWDRSGDRWEVPERIEPEKEDDKYARSSDLPDYHRIKTTSKKVLFIVDISGSMKFPIRYKSKNENRAGQTWVTKKKMDLAREELIRVIDTLDDKTWFNILAFESILVPYKPRPVKATRGSISAAKRWIQRLKPFQSDNRAYTKEGYIRGETNTFAAIKWLYGHKGAGMNFAGKLRPVADTVFLLSDGQPSCGELLVMDDILEQVRRYHSSSRVTIHTIAYDLNNIGREMLRRLAQVTGGESVEIGAER